MDATFAHPHWIVAGVLLIVGGFWLFSWARRNDTSAAVAAATTEAAINKLRKKSPAVAQAKPAGPVAGRGGARLRNSMAQLIGIIGVLTMIAGLVSVVFGIFYPAG